VREEQPGAHDRQQREDKGEEGGAQAPGSPEPFEDPETEHQHHEDVVLGAEGEPLPRGHPMARAL
jgi:hypothetical protein